MKNPIDLLTSECNQFKYHDYLRNSSGAIKIYPL